jgi:replication initiation protein RepC
LTPLVARAGEFEAIAEELRREARALRLIKERISLHRRDVAKLIACGLDEGLEGPWEAYRQRFMGLVTPLRRIKAAADFGTLEGQLAELRREVGKILENHINSQNIRANDDQNDRHESNSNTQWLSELEPASKKEGQKINSSAQTYPDYAEPGQVDADETSRKAAKANARAKPGGQGSPEIEPAKTYPLGMVLEACPDIRDYAASGSIRAWPEFLAAARLLRPMLGISPDAWREAVAVLGQGDAAIVMASILQRSEHSSQATRVAGEAPGSWVIAVNGSPAIKSPGGYLRALTEKARAGDFALGPILMALRRQRLNTKRAAA